MRVERRLAAILAADVAGYSRLMGADEVGTLEALKTIRREIIDPAIADHNGRLVKTTGDGLLVEFASAVDAVNCAMSVQQQMTDRSATASGPGIVFRIGINVGDIIIDGGDIFGDGVNIAARVEGESKPGGVCLSGSALEHVLGKTSYAFDDLGEKVLKNIERPVRLYAARAASQPIAPAAAPSHATLPLRLPDKPSIAVLPFDNMSSDPDQGFFADGMTEDVITTLSYISSLFVIARNSSFAYKGKARELRQIGKELGVRYLLEGSVRRSRDRIRITAQLIDAADGHHLWAEKYDRALADVFDIQDELTREITSALRVVLTEAEEGRVWQRSTNSIAAWSDAVRGVDHIWRGTAADMETARKFLLSATQRDPAYAKALVMLALTHYFDLRFAYTKDVEGAQREFATLVHRALEIDPSEPYAVGMLGNVHAFEGRFDDALAQADRALAISPNDAFLWLLAARLFVNAERLADGERAIRTAMRLNPFYPINYLAVLADALTHQDKGDEALEVLSELVRRNRNYISAHLHLAALRSDRGEMDEARAAVSEVLRINPLYRLSMARNFYLSADAGRKAAFVSALQRAGLPE
jgi:adenylate cyclase